MMSDRRGLVRALLLGLPVALLAHALVFGAGHAAGGGNNSALTIAAVLFFAVVSMRWRGRLPAFAYVGGSAALWFAGIELCEAPHDVPVLAVVAAIIVACVAVREFVVGTARTIAVVGWTLQSSRRHHPAALISGLRAWCDSVTRIVSFPRKHRLFSRPPPAFS